MRVIAYTGLQNKIRSTDYPLNHTRTTRSQSLCLVSCACVFVDSLLLYLILLCNPVLASCVACDCLCFPLSRRAATPDEIDGNACEYNQVAYARSPGHKVSKIKHEERSDEYIKYWHNGVAISSVWSFHMRRFVAHDYDRSDHQHVENKISRDYVFEQLRVDVAVCNCARARVYGYGARQGQ